MRLLPLARGGSATTRRQLRRNDLGVVPVVGPQLARVGEQVTKEQGNPLSKEQIDEYLAGIDPLDKAGGYAIQQDKDKIIKRVSGSVSNVIGLPVERLKEELNHGGFCWGEAFLSHNV